MNVKQLYQKLLTTDWNISYNVSSKEYIKYREVDMMEYIVTKGVDSNVTNYRPILTEEESEEINQEFLRFINQLFIKYGIE